MANMVDNLQRMMRLRGIFNPEVGNDLPSQGGITGSMTPDNDNIDIEGLIAKNYTPEHDATDRFNQLVSAYPEHEKAGFLRKLTASMVGFGRGGVGGASEVLDAPFNEKLVDWKNKIGPAQAGMTQERLRNVNERTLAYQTVSARLRQEAIDAKEKNDTTNARIRQQRADAYEFKTKNPDLKLVSTKGGNVFAINPRTGEQHDTGIPSGSLTDADRLALIQDQALERIGATGDESRLTEEEKEKNREELARVRGKEARETRKIPTGNASTNKPETASQTKVRQYNAAKQIFNTRPDLKPFLKFTGTNEFSITSPGKTILGYPSGPTQAQYDEMKKSVYGEEKKPEEKPKEATPPARRGAPPSSNPAKPAAKSAPAAPKGWKYVPKAGGGWTAVKDE